MTENAIEIRNAVKRYGDFTLRDVNLTLPRGCVLGLVGENGAGKTTLIRMILGTCRPDGGEVTVLGETADAGVRFAQVRQEIGVVLDEACLPRELTARQVGRMMAGIYKNWDMRVFSEYAQRFGLPQGKAVKTYSRGMKMKLAIAVALSHNARLLVLDEATGGLDPIVRDELLDVFSEFTRDESRSVLISSHIVSDLEKICDYIVFLHEGRVLMAEEKDALDEKYAIAVTDEADFDRLLDAHRSAVLRTMRAHGAVRSLIRRDAAPADALLERARIEEVMLLLTKGEEIQ